MACRGVPCSWRMHLTKGVGCLLCPSGQWGIRAPGSARQITLAALQAGSTLAHKLSASASRAMAQGAWRPSRGQRRVW